MPKLEKGRALTRPQARVLAARLANDAFAKTTFTDVTGKPVPKIVLRPESWRVAEMKSGRWVLKFDPPAGPQAEVSFAGDGSDPKVAVGLALE